MTARHLLTALAAAALIAAGCGEESEPNEPEPRAERDNPACDALRESDVAAAVQRTTGRRLEDIGKVEIEQTDSSETSTCGYYAGPGDDVAVKLIIDRARQAQKRYWYRLEEMNQRNDNWDGPDPRLVRGVADDHAYGGAGAFWIPSLSKLTSYRDDRMLTLIFFVPGVDDRASSRAAAAITKTAYRRMFGNRPPKRSGSLQDRHPHA
jgi:hypothetical protein